MIHKVEMWGATCDGCKQMITSYSGLYVLHDDADCLKEEMDYDGWHITDDGKTYCPNCHRFDDDDKLVLMFER